MYIAQKWLFGLVLAMWIGLCMIDLYVKNSGFTHLTEDFHSKSHNSWYIVCVNVPTIEFRQLSYLLAPLRKNFSDLIQRNGSQKTEKKIYTVQRNSSLISEYVTFVAGACLMLIYFRKNDFLLYARIYMKTISKYDIKKHFRDIKILKITAAVNAFCVAILKFLEYSKGIFSQIMFYLVTKYKKLSKSKSMSNNVNLLLLNKLREYSHERKNMGRVIIAAIQENKDIKMRYQLETLAKNRLVKHIQDTQKQVKENKSRYLNFQQLYLTSHQENIFLKSRIKKLALDKEDAERNLMKLVNHVWRSKNTELKAYCTRFIVRTKNNLLNSDVRAEIDQFLSQSCKTKQRHPDQVSRKLSYLDTIKEVNENSYEDAELTLVKDLSKSRSHSGECFWTVKDKNGFIDKLYEYETDFDNGDTVRRIRQYSVYFDKDCFLDVSSSDALIARSNIDLTSLRYANMKKRITGSEAFQKFLEDNKIIVLPTSRLTQPSLIY